MGLIESESLWQRFAYFGRSTSVQSIHRLNPRYDIKNPSTTAITLPCALNVVSRPQRGSHGPLAPSCGGRRSGIAGKPRTHTAFGFFSKAGQRNDTLLHHHSASAWRPARHYEILRQALGKTKTSNFPPLPAFFNVHFPQTHLNSPFINNLHFDDHKNSKQNPPSLLNNPSIQNA